MRKVKEARELLDKCKKARDKDELRVLASPEDCPLGDGCCPECSFMGGVLWMLGEYEI